MVRIDHVSLHILEALQQDGRTPVIEIARRVGRGETTVRDRLVSLESAGVVKGYRAVVDPRVLGYSVHAHLRASCEPRPPSEVAKDLLNVPNVVKAHLTTGPKPIRVEVWAKDHQALTELIEKRLAPAGLHGIEIGIEMQSLVENRGPHVRASPIQKQLAAQGGDAGARGPGGSINGGPLTTPTIVTPTVGDAPPEASPAASPGPAAPSPSPGGPAGKVDGSMPLRTNGVRSGGNPSA